MSLEQFKQRIIAAWDQLNRRQGAHRAPLGPPPTPRPRRRRPAATTGETSLAKAGFDEEALPWLGAVYRFALRLNRGDQDAANDLVQETFLRAYRAWERYERGTSCRSWLFTICKNAHLRLREKAGVQRELTESDLDIGIDVLAVGTIHDRAIENDLDATLFDHSLDDRVVRAIDDLPDDYRDVLVLSDLGDLAYAEIAEVLDIPIGTVKSRLFRARRILQETLLDYATEIDFRAGGSA